MSTCPKNGYSPKFLNKIFYLLSIHTNKKKRKRNLKMTAFSDNLNLKVQIFVTICSHMNAVRY